MATPSEVTNELCFQPPRLWGLNFHFNTFNKLYVSDILNMKPFPGYPGAFAYGNHPMYKVDVLGVVVRKDEKEKLYLYSVDDGTGVINCCCWKQAYSSNGAVAGEERGDWARLPETLQPLMGVLEAEREPTPYQLGDLVHVRGKLKCYRDMMEVVAFNHRKLDNSGWLVTRMLELPRLYRQCYDKPFVPPDRIQQELMRAAEGKGTSSQQHQSSMLQLMDWIEDHIVKERAEEFSLEDLMRVPQVAEWTKEMDLAGDSCVSLHRALRRLEEDRGTVCHRPRASPPYENLTGACPLGRQIMAVLRKECAKPKYAEKGCHYLHVLDELKRTVQYSCLSHAALMTVLTRLETNSDVIRVTDRCYMPL